MADIQNAKRQGTGQTWKEAYQDVDKTVASLRDLNEDFASFVADYNEFSDERKQRLQEYLDSLGDISEHWEEVNDWIDQNSESAREFTGSLNDVRSIFHDIISLTGGIRRETQERINLARRIERLAGDSVAALHQETGLNSQIVELQRRKGTSLREQVEFQARFITGQELIRGADERADLASQVNISNLQKARREEERKLAVLQDQLRTLQEQRSTGESRSLIRNLQEEIRYRQQNIEFLDLENIKAVQGLEDILSRRKELVRIQRMALSGPTEKGGAGEKAMPAARVDAVSKILSKFQQGDAAEKLKEEYNRWVTDRVKALEELEVAQKNLDAIRAESINRLKDLHVKSNAELDTYKDKIKGANDALGELLQTANISGEGLGNLGASKFAALTDKLQDQIFKFREAQEHTKSLREEYERLGQYLESRKQGIAGLVGRPAEREALKEEIKALERQYKDLGDEIKKATDQERKLSLEGKELKSRFKDGFITADFGENETLKHIADSVEASKQFEKALRDIQKVRAELGKESVNAKYFLNDLNPEAVSKIAQGISIPEALTPEGAVRDARGRYRSLETGAFVKGPDENQIAGAEKWAAAVQKAREESQSIADRLSETAKIQLDLNSLTDDRIEQLLEALKIGNESVDVAKKRRIEEDAIAAAQEAAEKRLKDAQEYKKAVFEKEFNLLYKISEAMKGNIAWATLGLMLALAIYRQLLKFDEEAVKTKRVIGQWADASALANTSFITGTEVLKTMREIGEQFHINPVQVFTPAELARVSQAQKLTGMTSEAAGNLAVQSKIIGKNANTYRDEIAKGANQANKLNHSAINLSAVQNDVLTTSRAITLSYGTNTKALAEAAGAAAAIGTNLQGVENIAKNLMQFESSIESEMQAQLLTGMQINLAKAREYALNNDLEGVAREVSRQGMDAAKFSHMNYIQQENMAKALGMSREEMSKMLIMQEINRGLTAEQVAAMTGMRRQDIEALSAQEKWQTMKQRFLESLVPLLEPVLQVTSDIFRLLNPLLGIISTIAGWISRIFNIIPENWVYLRGIVGLIAVAIPALLLKGSLIGRLFTGIFRTVKGIGQGILGWSSGLSKAGDAAKTANIGSTTKGTSSLNKSVGGMGKNASNLLKGAAAMVLIAGALWIVAKAAQEFSKVTWEDMGKAGTALTVFAGITIGVGYALKAAGSALVEAGIYLALFGVALIPVAFALRLAAPAFDAFANIVVAAGTAIKSALEGVAAVLTATFTGLGTLLENISLEKAAALLTLGAGFGILGAGLIAGTAGVLLFPIARFERLMRSLSATRFERIEQDLSTLGNVSGLSQTADELTQIGVALGGVAENLNKVDIRKFRRLTVANTLGNLGNALATRIAGTIPGIESLTAKAPEPQKNVLLKLEDIGNALVAKFAKSQKDALPKADTTRESKENKRENIEEAVQSIVVKQVEANKSAQQVSIEQKATDLSKIEKKLDNVITAIKNAAPTDWNWLEFNRTQAANA